MHPNAACRVSPSAAKERIMTDGKHKNSPERTEVRETPSRMPIETQDWDEIGTEEVQADDELSIRGERQVESEDAGDLSEDDDDNPYQESDEALPDDEEEKEISFDPEREGRRFGD
jgi:hypothetical protein